MTFRSRCNSLIFCFLLISFPAQAAVHLEQAIRSDGKDPLIDNISAMAVMPDGRLTTVDAGLKALVKFRDGKGNKLPLTGNGRAFSSGTPTGLALLDDGRLLVANKNQGIFALLQADAKPTAVLAQEGRDAGELGDPSAVAWTGNRRVYIAEQGNNRVSVFGEDGVFLYQLGQQGLGEKQRLRQPFAINVDRRGRVFVLDDEQGRGRVSIFSSKGNLLKQLDQNGLAKILGTKPQLSAMTIDNTGLLYLADRANGRVFQLDWETGKKLNGFGSKGEERGQFKDVTSLAVFPDHRLAVADSGNHKIEIYTLPAAERPALQPLRQSTILTYDPIPAKCSFAYRLVNGKGLCLDRDQDQVTLLGLRGDVVKQLPGKFRDLRAAASNSERIAIIDGDRIKLYSLDGEPRFEGKGYAGEGRGEGKLDAAQGLFLSQDEIYVADTGNRRIQIFSSDGIYLDKLASRDDQHPLFGKPTSVAVDAQNNLFVGDTELNQVLAFSPKMKLLYRIGAGKDENKGPFKRLYGIAMDTDNNLYVLCATRNNPYSVQVYHGPRMIMSFLSASVTRAGVQQPSNISVAKSRKTVIGIYDREKHGLMNFSYLQIPAKVSGLQVLGGLEQTDLRWRPVPGSFMAGYNVYGSETADGDYHFLAKVVAGEASIKHHNQKPYLFYKVSAATALGTESDLSTAEQDRFRQAYQLYENKDYPAAEKILVQLNQQQQGQAEVLKYLGQTQFELKDIDAAVSSFKALAKIPGHEKEGLKLLIKGLVAAEQYIEAKTVIDQVMEQKAAELNTYVICGDVSLKLGDAIGAVTCLEEAQKQDPENVEAHFLMADAYVRLGITDKGLAELKTAAELAPDNADVWYRSGTVMLSLKQSDEAVEAFKKALQLDPRHTAARLALAETYLARNQLDEVKNMAVQLATQPETAAQGQYLLGRVALVNDSNGEALLALTKSTRLDASNDKAWISLADTYAKMDQQDKVKQVLAHGLEACPASYGLAIRLGRQAYQDKNYGDAAKYLAIAVSSNGKAYEARYQYADALYQTRDYNQALEQARQAQQLNGDAIEPLVLMSHITNQQGKIGKAIDYMKQALEKQPNNAGLYTDLGELYTGSNLFDLAQMQLEKAALLDAAAARPYVLMGQLYLKRRLFDKAIAALDKAVSLAPTADNKLLLDSAYGEKKKSLEFKSNVPQIVLKDLNLNRVFSATYKQYADKPVGKIRIQNTSGTDYGNLKLAFAIKGYMDYPSSQEIEKLPANSSQEYELFASFNNRILDIDEDTGVQVEVRLEYVRDGQDDAIKLTQPMTIYGKNAILWGDADMVGSFVTPRDDTLRDFVRQAINENKPEPGPLNPNLVSAMTLFDVLSADGIRYVVDPNSPYAKVKSDRVDYVQFGRETLKIKSGDCDDLSVLLSAGLENLGVETAVLDVPGHLFMMFNCGLDETKADQISLQQDLLVMHDGKVWIPLEATMIGTSFSEAWAEGARKYNKYSQAGKLHAIFLHQAWDKYRPVTLKPASYSLTVPDKQKVGERVSMEQKILLKKSLDRLVKPYEVMAAAEPKNVTPLMQVAITYARYGLYDAAEKTFEKIQAQQPDNSAVPNNRGNIYYMQNQYDKAIESYRYAEQLAANDPGIKMNLAMANYKLGQLDEAREKFEEAVTIDADVAQRYQGLSKLLSR